VSDSEPDSKRKVPPSASPLSADEQRQQRIRFWRDQFKTGQTKVLDDVIAELVRSKQYDEVVICIEQAILGGVIIEPWMHEALALAMQASGRSKDDIARVVMSSQDLTGGDSESMMKLAAYLTRLERYDRALEIYRQVSHLSPGRPEPFIRALDLARRTGNADAVVWCAPEVLAMAWGREREPLRRSAEQAAADAIPQLTRAGKIAKALQLQEAMQQARVIDLIVRLEFNGVGDVDLLVEEPTGSVCSISNPFTTAGGAFVHDGHGPRQENCFDEYVCASAIPGEYRLIVRHIRGDIVAKRARLIITRGKDTPDETVETQTVLLSPTDTIVRISLSRGRRQIANAEAPKPPVASRRSATAGTAVLAQIAPAATGVIPNVGGGAVGYQPVISMISEGITMNALATVSGDRRYVRINANPVFSNITDVFTFSFLR